MTGGMDQWLSAARFCGRAFNRSCSTVFFAATVTVIWQAGHDSLLLFTGCGQQGECVG